MRTIFISLTALIMLNGCAGTSAENTEADKNIKADFKRNPKATFSNNEQEVEVFDFENFKPFLEEEDDTIHVVNFWATWCIPCVAELPYFEKLNSQGGNIEVTLVSLDFYNKIEDQVLPFMAKNELKSDVIVLHEPDANAWISKIDSDWSGAIPATVIYRGDKKEFYEQSFTFEELTQEVEKFKN